MKTLFLILFNTIFYYENNKLVIETNSIEQYNKLIMTEHAESSKLDFENKCYTIYFNIQYDSLYNELKEIQ